MSAIKKFCKEECQLHMIGLEHQKPSDFYLSVWQTTRSAVPLLIWRTLLFLTALGIIISSLTFYILSPVSVGYWFIYLTHWGLLLMLLSTGFAVGVSARCYFYGPISTEYCLPWYVKTYWVLYNISVPLAFLITVFYWSLLYDSNFLEEMNRGLDIAIHGINSLVMFLLLISSTHSTRLVHLAHPLVLAAIYVIFGVIYYVAGGTDPYGNPYVYPVVDWTKPGTACLVIFITLILLFSLHLVTMGISAIRTAVANKILRPNVAVQVDEDLALRNRNESLA
ncbi:protein rolling stone-like [Colias croceus]|uniref:protein rolling stone-like n=1 Tax=Colias crocea TaxID=72248 RepID=UPI001E27DB58|nr:protein rolling stone-like [Colias croceus]